MASMFVQKYKRKPNTQTKDEFFVKEDKSNTVCQFRNKIERMYNIASHFEKQPVEGGHWMCLEGEPIDRRNAKNYIKAICQPEETKKVKFPASTFKEFSNGSTLENIEKSTNAVIRPLKSIATFEISGTELGVTLALSQMEEIAGSFHLDPETELEDEAISDENVFQISPVTNNASKRLSTTLERALSEHSDGICSIDDYKDAPLSVKRVLVNCLADNDLDNIDEDLLFDDGQGKVRDKNPVGLSYIRIYSDSGDTEDDPISILDVDGEKDSEIEKTSDTDSINEQFTDTTIACEESRKKISKQQDYLKNFGISVGYPTDKVQRALQFVHEKTRPSDFLDILNGLSESHTHEDDDTCIEGTEKAPIRIDESYENNSDEDEVIILETETIDMETGQGETVKHDGKDGKERVHGFNEYDQGRKKSLPDEYREQLVRDFLQESDNNLSVEELKRRNAERQRLLKENFLKQNNQQSVKPGANPQAGGKKKSKKKKKQNQAQQQQKQQGVNSEKTDSGENRTYSQDDEQTCVMHLWTDSIRESDSNCAPYKNQDQYKPAQRSKPKQHNEGSHTQIAGNKTYPCVTNPNYSSQSGHPWTQAQVPTTNWSQPLAQKQDFRQKSPSRNKHGQWNPYQQYSQQQQSPQRGNSKNSYNQGKPTQVVTPNFAGAPQAQSTQWMAPESDDLRYIVIDGSNVAMSHGNGKCFSCKGLRICVDYFKQRGHKKITVFVPQWRTKRPTDDNPVLDQNILHELKDEEVLVFTPSRRIGRKMVASYDDRFVMELAEAEDGIIVSNDQYRDLMMEKRSWRKLVEERLLMYSFVKDRFMPPNDPLGRDGPCLDVFLRKTETSSSCQGAQGRQDQGFGQGHQGHFQGRQGQNQGQFGQYQGLLGPFPGHQGQFQGHQGQTQGQFPLNERDFPRFQDTAFKHPGPPPQKFKPPSQKANYGYPITILDELDGPVRSHSQGKGGKLANKGGNAEHGSHEKGLNTRSLEDTERLFAELKTIFPKPDQEEKIRIILANHAKETDLVKLTNYCMSVLFL